MPPPDPSAASPGGGRAPAAPPSPLGVLGGREGVAAGEREAEAGRRAPGAARLRLPRGLAGAGEAARAGLRAPQAEDQHGAQGRVGEGPRKAPAEAAAAAALCPAHNAPGAKGAPKPRPPPSPLLKGAIDPGAGHSRAARRPDLWPSPGPRAEAKRRRI